MSTPTSIQLTLCRGALRKLFSNENFSEFELPDLARPYASSLRGALSRHYGTPEIRVELRPEKAGRMLLVFGGSGVDVQAETDQIWAMAQKVTTWMVA